MKIHVNANENVIDALENIVGFLKKNMDGCGCVSGKGMNLYLELETSDGLTCQYNDCNYVLRDGEIVDLDNEMFAKASAICEKSMLSVINDVLENYEPSLRKKIADKEKRLQRAIERNFGTVDKWHGELEFLRKLLEEAPLLMEQYRKMKEMVMADEIAWAVMYEGGKSIYDVRTLFLRPAIDLGRKVFGKPIYFYKNDFSVKVIDDETFWFAVPAKDLR